MKKDEPQKNDSSYVRWIICLVVVGILFLVVISVILLVILSSRGPKLTHEGGDMPTMSEVSSRIENLGYTLDEVEPRSSQKLRSELGYLLQ